MPLTKRHSAPQDRMELKLNLAPAGATEQGYEAVHDRLFS